jgi:hypothetical protein
MSLKTMPGSGKSGTSRINGLDLLDLHGLPPLALGGWPFLFRGFDLGLFERAMPAVTFVAATSPPQPSPVRRRAGGRRAGSMRPACDA